MEKIKLLYILLPNLAKAVKMKMLQLKSTFILRGYQVKTFLSFVFLSSICVDADDLAVSGRHSQARWDVAMNQNTDFSPKIKGFSGVEPKLFDSLRVRS
jgi:hypothetical protein